MRISVAVLFLLALISISYGQDISHSVASAAKKLKDMGAITVPKSQVRPLEPGQLPSPEKALPPAIDGRSAEMFVLRNANNVERRGNNIKASGDVRFSFRGYDVRAEQVEGDLRTNIFLVHDQVVVVGQAQTIHADSVLIDFDRRTFRYLEGTGTFGPDFIGGTIIDNLYVRGKSVWGTSREIECEICGLTTCDHEQPHFEFRARRATIRVGKRAILRDVDFMVLNKKVFRIPFLVIPLERNTERNLPEFGQSRDEGYYVKTRWPMVIRGNDVFTGRLDYYTKLGNGFGGDYEYDHQNIAGVARVFALTRGQNAIVASLDHRQNIFNGTLTVNSNYQKNNYITSPDNTTWSTRMQYVLPQKTGSSSLSMYRTSNSATNFSSLTETYSLTDQRQLPARITSNLNVNLSSSNSQSQGFQPTKRSIVDLNYVANQESRYLTAMLEYRRSIPITTEENFFSSSDRTPSLSLKSASSKLFGQSFGTLLPFNTEFSIGEIANPGERNRLTRIGLNFDLRKQLEFSKRASLSVYSAIRQAIYSDDTAQYVLTDDAAFRYSLGKDSAFNLRYNYVRPYGFTPLAIDNSGTTNIVSADLTVRPIKDLLFATQTGYDIQQLKLKQSAPWQSVNFRLEYVPANNKVRVRTTALYDSGSQVWRNIRTDFTWFSPWGRVAGGAQYDANRSTWSSFTLLLDTFKFGKITSSALFSYNGYLKKMESMQLQFIYDLHCTELILQLSDNQTGFRSGREIQLFLRIKALPFDSLFGVGRRGQSIGAGGIGF